MLARSPSRVASQGSLVTRSPFEAGVSGMECFLGAAVFFLLEEVELVGFQRRLVKQGVGNVAWDEVSDETDPVIDHVAGGLANGDAVAPAKG